MHEREIKEEEEEEEEKEEEEEEEEKEEEEKEEEEERTGKDPERSEPRAPPGDSEEKSEVESRRTGFEFNLLQLQVKIQLTKSLRVKGSQILVRILQRGPQVSIGRQSTPDLDVIEN